MNDVLLLSALASLVSDESEATEFRKVRSATLSTRFLKHMLDGVERKTFRKTLQESIAEVAALQEVLLPQTAVEARDSSRVAPFTAGTSHTLQEGRHRGDGTRGALELPKEACAGETA